MNTTKQLTTEYLEEQRMAFVSQAKSVGIKQKFISKAISSGWFKEELFNGNEYMVIVRKLNRLETMDQLQNIGKVA